MKVKKIPAEEIFEAFQSEYAGSIQNPNGPIIPVAKGDWILKDDRGMLHICNEDVFESRYKNIQEAKEDHPIRPMLSVDVIPQAAQRYPTVGDWSWMAGALVMHISDMQNPDYEFMVAIHEAVEAYICRKRGITGEMVDAWDMGDGKDLEDPGAHPDCPYHREHMLALEIERMICIELGLDWDKYEQCLADICPTMTNDGEHQER